MRHLYLLGFATHLIVGTAPRLVPGLLGAHRVARPRLVGWSFSLVLAATVLRVAALLTPAAFLSGSAVLSSIVGAAFGVSGLAGMAGIAVLAVNLRATARTAKR